MESGKFVFEVLGMAPYNLVKRSNYKFIRVSLFLFSSFIWTPIIAIPFIPYLIYKMLVELTNDV